MKIAIISGHYIPELGYQEVYLSRALARLGNEIIVVTSPVIPKGYKNNRTPKSYNTGTFSDDKYGFKIIRLPVVFSAGTWVYSKNILKNVKAFAPDAVIVLAVGKLFPLPVYRKKRTYKIITLFGNNSDYLNWQSISSSLSSIGDILKNKLIRNHLYKKAILYSDLVFNYTNETPQILSSFLNKEQKKIDFYKKSRQSSLGFDADEYYFNEEDFYVIRKKYVIPEDSIVITTATRVDENKRIETIIEALKSFDKPGNSLFYILIGFLNNSYGDSLQKYIENNLKYIKFIYFPFLDSGGLRQLYSASDLGIWIKPAISILEAMGCGLKVILENKPDLDHLVADSGNGWLYSNGLLTETLGKAVSYIQKLTINERLSEKKNTAEYNYRKFSYNSIGKNILEQINLL